MRISVKRCYRLRRNQSNIIFVVILLWIVYNIRSKENLQKEFVVDFSNRNSVIKFVEDRLEEALREDKGTGCEIPKLDPFANEIMYFNLILPKVTCPGKDWVRCYLSECKVVDKILSSTKHVACIYQDILYLNDYEFTLGPPTEVIGNNTYILEKSDHVKIICIGTHNSSSTKSTWIGHAVGFRRTVERKPTLAYRRDTPNVLIFGFDSTSKNGFIRKMPKSYRYIMRHLQGTLLEGYNIVGKGTPAALIPILTGKNELELPDVRKTTNGTVDSMPFLFYMLKEDGYRTAFFEDMQWIGTFQNRFNGFRKQPADHYLRAFSLLESNHGKRWHKLQKQMRWIERRTMYCVGDTPRYKLMMNITDQFFKLDRKKFGFTFIADITHGDFNMISTADEAFVEFLQGLVERDVFEDTMLIIMGDHGTRHTNFRDSLQGKLEERLPLMYIQLPSNVRRANPRAVRALAGNARALCTPYDLHATILHALDWKELRNSYRVKGADFMRGMSLLEPIPRNRSCSEAGIEPHWCTCLAWRNVSDTDALYMRAGHALLDYINSLTEPVRSKCIPRTLTSVEWLLRLASNQKLSEEDTARTQNVKELLQTKIVTGPGVAIFEATVIYHIKEDNFFINSRDVSRINKYGREPRCIMKRHPHLESYCYCK